MNIIQRIFGPAVSRIIMPAQNRKDTYEDLRAIRHKDGVDIQRVAVDSTGGAVLDMAMFRSQHPKPARKVIIYTMGQSSGYETKFDALVSMAKKYPEAILAGYNFRNVNASTGIAYCEQDWIDDAKAIVNHFRGMGFKRKDILVHGYSLGGAISTMAVASLIKEEQKEHPQAKPRTVRLINDRSFSDIIEEILESLLGKNICAAINFVTYAALTCLSTWMVSWLFSAAIPAATITLMGMFVGGTLSGISLLHQHFCFKILRPWATILVKLTFGMMDAFHDYQEIPEHAKDYLVVKHDSRITKRSGLHYELKPTNQEKKREIFNEIRALQKALQSSEDEQQTQNLQGQIETLTRTLRDIHDSKLIHRYVPKDGHAAHTNALDYLTTYHHLRGHAGEPEQITGQQVLENKINRLLRL